MPSIALVVPGPGQPGYGASWWEWQPDSCCTASVGAAEDRLAQHRAYLALPFRAKLEALEEMGRLVEKFGRTSPVARRTSHEDQ